MEDIIRVALLVTVCCVFVVLIRQHRPEMTILLQLSGLVAVILTGLTVIKSIIDYVSGLLSASLIPAAYMTLLIKGLGVAAVSKIAGDLCRDSGNNALGFGVELMAKGIILLMTLPMLKNLADITSGLLNGY